jgi:hypothetical protein
MKKSMAVCHLVAAAMPVIVSLALTGCAPVITASASYEPVQPASMTFASAMVPPNPNGRSQVIDGFLIDTGPPQPVDPQGRYYVEFRARWINHTYVVYGRLDTSGNPLDQHFIALYPRNGVFGVAAGSLPLIVPATTLPVPGDKEADMLAVYRSPIDAAQYEKIQNFVYQTRSNPDHYWNLYTINCNYFAAQIANVVGLKAPVVYAQITPLYIKQLESLNEEGSAHLSP